MNTKRFSELKTGQTFMRAGKKPGSVVNTVFQKVSPDTYRKQCMTQTAKADTVKYPFLDIDPSEQVHPV